MPPKEVIHVFTDAAGMLRTDHSLTFGGLRFLTLRYEIPPVG